MQPIEKALCKYGLLEMSVFSCCSNLNVMLLEIKC
jgi:hypothetical protein